MGAERSVGLGTVSAVVGLSQTGWVNPRFLPSPDRVVAALVRLWQQGLLLSDTFASFGRVSLGFILAAAIATPLGIAMGAFASIRALFEPIVGILRYMPAPAFTPLLIIYLGLDEAPKIGLIFIGTVFFNVSDDYGCGEVCAQRLN